MAAIALVGIAGAATSAAGISGVAAFAITTAAGIIGTFIDQLLFAKDQTIEGPKLDETRFRSSAVSTPITRVWGCIRVPTAVIWSTRFDQNTEKDKVGKGGGSTTVETTTYSVSFAVGVCEGPVQGLHRIWADNRVLDQSEYTIRKYLGTASQARDPKIAATEGEDFTPGFRHVAYIVFEEFQLEEFGNHIPQINVEVCREPVVEVAPVCGPKGTEDPLVVDTGHTIVNWSKRHLYGQYDSGFDGLESASLDVYDIDTLTRLETKTLPDVGAFGGVDEDSGYLIGNHFLSPDTWRYVYDPETNTYPIRIKNDDVGQPTEDGSNDILCRGWSPIYVLKNALTGEKTIISADVTPQVRLHDFNTLSLDGEFYGPNTPPTFNYLPGFLGPKNDYTEAAIIWKKDDFTEFKLYKYVIDTAGSITESEMGTIVPTDIDSTLTTIDLNKGPNPMFDPGDDSWVFWTEASDGAATTRWLIKFKEGTGITWVADITGRAERSDPNFMRSYHRLEGGRFFWPTESVGFPPEHYTEANLSTGNLTEHQLSGCFVSLGVSAWNDADSCLYQWETLDPGTTQSIRSICFEESELPSASDKIKAINLIPGYGEYSWGTTPVTTEENTETGLHLPLNSHRDGITADLVVSLDALELQFTKARRVSMPVGWTFDDLRCDTAEVRPRPRSLTYTVDPADQDWVVSEETRSGAPRTVSLQSSGLPYYDGTPSDKSVREGIQEVKARNLGLTFLCKLYPDIPPGNTLTDPYTGGSGQNAFPWEGRITLNAAPGEVGSSYKTASAATEIGTFFGDETAADFGAWNGTTIPFSGTATSWTYRRMILHYAKLCEQSGMETSEDVFVIGVDLAGLTHIQDDLGNFPAVDELVALLAEVKLVWTNAGKIPPQFTYAAHWTEWNVNHANDGSGDILFHLDTLWTNSDIAAIGINFLPPLSDWRDEPNHLDGQTYKSIYEAAYLQSQIEGGEHFDYTYESTADRDSQTRTTIDDPDAASEDWIFRRKDIRNWWLNSHHDRPGGVRNASANSWTAESKPVWLMKIGTGAHNKSTNRPDALPDSESEDEFAEAAYYSNDAQDTIIQQACLEAIIDYWEDDTVNPDSTQYTGKMISTPHIYTHGWDHRPYPEWPSLDNFWGDTRLYLLGHWLQGRLEGSPASGLIGDLMASAGLESVDYDVSEVFANVRGYYVADTLSMRDIINPLAATYFFDAYESEGQIKFRARGGASALTITEDDMVRNESSGEQETYGPLKAERGQETELPGVVRVNFVGDDPDYSVLPVQTQREFGDSLRVSEMSPNLVMSSGEGQVVADILMHEAWISRDTAEVDLMPSKLALDPTDVLDVTYEDRTLQYRITGIGDRYTRPTQLVRTERSIYDRFAAIQITRLVEKSVITGKIILQFLDLPLLGTTSEVPHAPWLAAVASPWPGGAAVYRLTGSTFELDKILSDPSRFGKTLTALNKGTHGIFLRGTTLDVEVGEGTTLQSLTELDVLNGANIGVLVHSTGAHEVLQWTTATLIGTNQYRLSGLLRSQLGTEINQDDPLAIGSRLVILGPAVQQSTITSGLVNVDITWEYGPPSGSPGDSNFKQQQFTPRAVGLRPLSPVSLSARKDHSNNDIHFKWIRRTRISGDVWDNTDVPLGETLERYKILIYNGSTIVREIIVDDQTTGTYTNAQQTADSFTVGTTLDWGVQQFSGEYGYGAERKITSTFLA